MAASVYEVTARNFSTASENKMHSDEVAQKFGFRGALVPGVAVYGHLTYPLVEAFGDAWLGHSQAEVRLIKPAYHGDTLSVIMTAEDQGHHVTCTNQDGALLATLRSLQPIDLPAAENWAQYGRLKTNGRVEIAWDNVIPNQLFPDFEVTLSQEMNRQYIEQIADPLEIYQQGRIHPHLLLSLANRALMEQYVMPAWIHVGSETRHRVLLMEGDTIRVRTAVQERWQKKGHEFIRIYIGYFRGTELAVDILHTAIFKVAA